MQIQYGVQLNTEHVIKALRKITNQIYKLLPCREEGGDWRLPLSTLIEELGGMSRLLFDQQESFFILLCKLEGLFILTEEKDFFLYRRTIFECLNLMNSIITECQATTISKQD